jgi:glycosyltransferase involved in cell wall biosynthesis
VVAIPHSFLDQKARNWSFRLIYYFIKYRPNIVISSTSFSYRSVVSFLYAVFYRKRFILWIEESREHKYSGQLLKRLLKSLKNLIGIKIIQNSHSLVVGGTAAKKYALSIRKAKNNIFMAMQCSNDLMLQKNIKHQNIKIRNKKKTFLYLSRITPMKGLDLLIKAFSLLKIKRADVFLLIAGDGPFRPYCQKYIESQRIHDVVFFGSVNPKNDAHIYEQADVFILPSYCRKNKYESWGLVINEAMSMNLPIITTTAVGAAYDMVIDGYNGIIARENDIEHMYQAMEKILEMDLLQMGKNSRIIFENKNDFIQMANGFTSAIEHALL